MQHFERKWVSIHLVFFGLSYPNVSLSFPRLKAQELVGWWFCSPLTSTSWERKKIMTNLCVANILSTWKVEKSGKMCDVLKVNRLKSCLECFCFPVVSPFFLQYCSFGQKSIYSHFAFTQEALQKMRISRQIHLPQLHTPEQITEALVENQRTMFFYGRIWGASFHKLIINVAEMTHQVAGIEDIQIYRPFAFKVFLNSQKLTVYIHNQQHPSICVVGASYKHKKHGLGPVFSWRIFDRIWPFTAACAYQPAQLEGPLLAGCDDFQRLCAYQVQAGELWPWDQTDLENSRNSINILEHTKDLRHTNAYGMACWLLCFDAKNISMPRQILLRLSHIHQAVQ